MNKTFDIRLTGTLAALAPINIVTPNAVVDKLPGGGKATRIASMDIMRDNGEVVNLPVITASTIRGKLRRAAANICLARTEDRPGLKPYLYSVLGGIKGAEKEDTYSIGRRNERRVRNPVISLFGASAPWDASRAIVGNAIPTTDVKPMLVTGTRTDEFVRNNDITEIIDHEAFADYLQVRENVRATSDAKGEVSKLIQLRAKADKEGKTARVAELEGEIRKAKADAEEAATESGNSIQMPFSYYAIPQGTRFAQEILLKGVTMAEAGLFLAALDEVFNSEPQFGGKSNSGYGLVSAEWQVAIRDRLPQRTSWRKLGAIVAKPYEDLEVPAELATDVAKAWDGYLAGAGMNLLVEGAEENGVAAANDTATPAKGRGKAKDVSVA